jgi:hypothetical protein
VNPEGNDGFWPQGRVLSPKIDGTWKRPVALGGSPGDKFNIVLVTVDAHGHRQLNEYMDRGEKTNDFPGKPLPDGYGKLFELAVERE